MTRRKTYRRIPPPEVQVQDALDLIARRGWTSTTLDAAGADRRLQRLALAEIAHGAWTAIRQGSRDVSPIQREILATLRITTPFTAHRQANLLRAGAIVAAERARLDAPPDPPRAPNVDRIDARRLLGRVYGRRPGPRIDHAGNVAAGLASSLRAGLDRLSDDAVRALAAVVLDAVDDETVITSAETDVLDWARGTSETDPGRTDEIRAHVAIAEAGRRGILGALVARVQDRLDHDPEHHDGREA